jgi:hypothetical protein
LVVTEYRTLHEASNVARRYHELTGNRYVVLTCTGGFFVASKRSHALLWADRRPVFTTDRRAA